MDRDCRQGAVLSLPIRTVTQAGSTNADLIALARGGAEDGLWLVAGRQTAGRGRQGRHWDSPPGNVYASALVRLRPGDPPAPTLALIAAVALEEVVRGCVEDVGTLQLKWPNDLLLGGAKLSGILLERAEEAVVIGFGVNLAHHPNLAERRTTSLAAHGAAPTPAAFVPLLAEALARWIETWRSAGPAPVVARWLAHAHPVGTPLSVRLPDDTRLAGTFDGLTGDGALLLRVNGDVVRVIHAADVFLA